MFLLTSLFNGKIQLRFFSTGLFKKVFIRLYIISSSKIEYSLLNSSGEPCKLDLVLLIFEN